MERPNPPVDLLESLWLTLRPAPEVWKWIQREILGDTGSIHIRYSSDNSVLGTIAGNVSEALKRAILDAERFMMGDPDEAGTVFWLNQSFFDETMTAQDILAQVQLWQQGLIAKSDLRTNLRQGGVLEADRTDELIDDELAQQAPVDGSDTGGGEDEQ